MSTDVIVTRRVEEFALRERGQLYAGPVIDTDVHHTWPSQEALLPYMARKWREYVESPGSAGLIPFSGSSGYFHPHGFKRDDAFPVVSGRRQKAGSNYELMRDQLLDPFRIRKALLTYDEALFALPGIPNPYFASELARAMNDYTADQWLSRDVRSSRSKRWPKSSARPGIPSSSR